MKKTVWIFTFLLVGTNFSLSLAQTTQSQSTDPISSSNEATTSTTVAAQDTLPKKQSSPKPRTIAPYREGINRSLSPVDIHKTRPTSGTLNKQEDTSSE